MSRFNGMTRAFVLCVPTFLCCLPNCPLAHGEESQASTSISRQQEETLEERMERIVSDWEQRKPKRPETVATQKYDELFTEWQQAAAKDRDFEAFAERMIRLAHEHHGDVGARDALSWVASSGRPGTYPKLRLQAVQLLIEHHSDDAEVARSLLMTNIPAKHWDVLLNEIVSKGTRRETKGIARLALARYLRAKLLSCEQQRKQGGEPTVKLFTDDYENHLKSCDLKSLKQRMIEIVEEVVRDYADIPYLRTGNFAALDFYNDKSLGQVAVALRDEFEHVAVGKPAPQINGMDLDGNTMSLSQHRGDVVVLVFWASWCGPCMQKAAEQHDLVKRMADKPFTLLGVNGDSDVETAQKAAKAANANWRSWFDGFPAIDSGPIFDRYHVSNIPHTIILDGEGTIRGKNVSGKQLENLVDKLIAEIEPANARQ